MDACNREASNWLSFLMNNCRFSLFFLFPVDFNNNVCFIVLSLSVSLQWPVPGVFPIRAHRAGAAKPQPGHDERWEEEIKDVHCDGRSWKYQTNICDILILLNESIQSKRLLS